MGSPGRSEVGLLCVAGAIVLGIASMLFPYIWEALLPPVAPAGQESFYLALHTVWIPLSGLALLAAGAAFLGAGFFFMWRERSRAGPDRRTFLGLAAWGLAGTSVGGAIRTLLGSFLGFVDVPSLRISILAVDVTLSMTLGLTLYWLLLGMGVRQARLAGIAALLASSGGSVVGGVARATQSTGGDAVAMAAGFLSAVLWLALFLWGYEEVRLRGASRPPALPA